MFSSYFCSKVKAANLAHRFSGCLLFWLGEGEYVPLWPVCAFPCFLEQLENSWAYDHIERQIPEDSLGH